MESMQELIPFAKEMLSQKPTRGMLKVYLVGSAFAVLGTVIGLVETVCHPFSSGEELDSEMILMMAQEKRAAKAKTQRRVVPQEEKEEEEEEKEVAAAENTTLSKTPRPTQRSMANRLHAS